jgi:phosphatidylserine/phosphatidylglycerophosphate/cardiolipin synthase-like enzyme
MGWQLREPLWWAGRNEARAGRPEARNPRFVALMAAARRGARVRLLLDDYFDDPAGWNANRRTALAANRWAREEGLDLSVRVGNPAGKGIHAKTFLVSLPASGEHWTHIGSLNGTEAANKVNREVALQIDSGEVYGRVAAVFRADWQASGFGTAILPAALSSSPLR